jgi:hypothetical protein
MQSTIRRCLPLHEGKKKPMLRSLSGLAVGTGASGWDARRRETISADKTRRDFMYAFDTSAFLSPVLCAIHCVSRVKFLRFGTPPKAADALDSSLVTWSGRECAICQR